MGVERSGTAWNAIGEQRLMPTDFARMKGGAWNGRRRGDATDEPAREDARPTSSFELNENRDWPKFRVHQFKFLFHLLGYSRKCLRIKTYGKFLMVTDCSRG